MTQLASTIEVDREFLPTTKYPYGWRAWVLRIVAALFAPVLMLTALEAGLRISGVGFPASLTIPCTVAGKNAACYNLFFAAPFFPPGMIKTPQMFAIPKEKPK